MTALGLKADSWWGSGRDKKRSTPREEASEAEAGEAMEEDRVLSYFRKDLEVLD